MFLYLLLATGLAAAVTACRTRHRDPRFAATYAAAAVFVLALFTWDLW